jgi:carbon-monoxide dehydrogenase medium subunit
MQTPLGNPAVLVDVGGLRDLSYINDAGDHIAIGGLTRHHDVEHSEILAEHVPLLAAAAGEVGDPRFAIEALRGFAGPRRPRAGPRRRWYSLLGGVRSRTRPPVSTIAASDFEGFEMALAPDEVITEVRARPMAAAGRSRSSTGAQDWAIVGVAAVTGDDPAVALVNRAPFPCRRGGSSPREWGVSGRRRGGADEGTDPPSDLNATPEFRWHGARLTRRALHRAMQRRQHRTPCRGRVAVGAWSAAWKIRPLTGRATYIDNLQVDGMLEPAPSARHVAHANLVSIDERRRGMGVVACTPRATSMCPSTSSS